MNVYNIVWADDEIDDLLNDFKRQDLEELGFNIIGEAHNGHELERILSKIPAASSVDAVIVDANFNEKETVVNNERDTTGLDYARGLFRFKYNKNIPFFLYTNRSEEILKEKYKDNPTFFEDFPRHKRWFKKSVRSEYEDMLSEIKKTVDEMRTTSFIIRNRYQYELNAATLIDGAQELIFELLVSDYDNNLAYCIEPFARIRKLIEKMFVLCENWCIIPPISSNTNGTAGYFLHNKYREKNGDAWIYPYHMEGYDIMAKPLAYSLNYIVDLTQDGSHTKKGLKLKVDEYFEQTKDTLLLKSIVFILIDLIKWFAITALKHKNPEVNKDTLWKKIEEK